MVPLHKDEPERLAEEADDAALEEEATDDDWAWLRGGLPSVVDGLVRLNKQRHLEEQNERLRMELAPTGPPEALQEAETWKAKYLAMQAFAKGLDRDCQELRAALRRERLEREHTLALDGGRTVDAAAGTHHSTSPLAPQTVIIDALAEEKGEK